MTLLSYHAEEKIHTKNLLAAYITHVQRVFQMELINGINANKSEKSLNIQGSHKFQGNMTTLYILSYLNFLKRLFQNFCATDTQTEVRMYIDVVDEIWRVL